VLDELDYLVNRWQIEFVEVVDNILDLKYFDSVLPALAQARRPIQLVYETKANLTRHQVRLLSQAGVGEIQPGIESLSNHILKLMRKGTTALRNIQLLKWCKEFNIVVDWNILYGFPGETREDYREMLELLRAIRFLAPPRVCAPIRLDRFSPFFNDPAAFGFTNLRATAPYKYLYPFEAESLNRIAYYYDYDYPPYMNPAGYADEVRAFVEDWRLNPETGMLISTRLPEGKLVLKDSRQNAPYPELVLSAPEQVVYEFCDALHTAPVIFEHVRQRFGSVTINEQAILDFLDFLVKCRLMVTDGQYYLSLAIKAQPPSIQPDARSVSNVSVHKVQ
jgi:ribosomal peptide maturation radical SAM protein 1